MGGKGRTFHVDPSELCWFWLEKMAKECEPYMKIDEIYYLIPGKSLYERLRRVYNDKEVLEMTNIIGANRFIDLYVVHGIDEPRFVPLIGALRQETLKKKAQQPHKRKLTPRRPPFKANPTKQTTNTGKTSPTKRPENLS